MTDFEERTRFTREEAETMVPAYGGRITHLLDNQDGTFSVMGHINCEWCDYCEERKQTGSEVHIAKANPYSLQGAQA